MVDDFVHFYAGCREDRPCLKLVGPVSVFFFFFFLHGSFKAAH